MIQAALIKVLSKFVIAFFAEKALTELLLKIGDYAVKSTKTTMDDEWFKAYKESVRNVNKQSN